MKKLWAWTKDLFWLVFAVALVAGGVFGFQYLGAIRPDITAQPAERPVTLVDTQIPVRFDGPLPIRGEGFVRPYREVALAAEGSGRITEMHPALDSRGSFKAGEVLVRLDDQTARAQLDQIEANVSSTQARLDLNATQLERAETLRARGVIAQDQLDQLETQAEELTASLGALNAQRRSAQVALSRSEIHAPFDGTVMVKAAELGSVVSPGQSIATLFTSDRLEITVPVRQSDAALIPGLFQGNAAAAVVEAEFAGQRYTWQAEVARVDTALDVRTRTLDVTLRLLQQDASDVAAPASGLPPALINAFATVTIAGAQPDDVYALPSTAFRSDGEVWLFVVGRLQRHPATRLHVDGEQSFLQMTDLPAGAEVITSVLDVAFNDMPLRKADDTRRAEVGN